LSLNSAAELTGHAAQSELGRERKSRELGLVEILEGKRLEANEILSTVGTNGSVRGELDGVSGGNINALRDRLEKSLLLGISNVDGDLGITELLKGGGATVILPADLNLLASGPCGRADRGSGVDGCHSLGSEGESDERSSGEHFQYKKGVGWFVRKLKGFS
jgi:hypothetical protein